MVFLGFQKITACDCKAAFAVTHSDKDLEQQEEIGLKMINSEKLNSNELPVTINSELILNLREV